MLLSLLYAGGLSSIAVERLGETATAFQVRRKDKSATQGKLFSLQPKIPSISRISMQQCTGQCSLVSSPLHGQPAVVTSIRCSPAAVSRSQQFDSHARAKQLCRPNRSRCASLAVPASRVAEELSSAGTQVLVSLDAEISHLQRLLEQLQLQHSAQDKVGVHTRKQLVSRAAPSNIARPCDCWCLDPSC